MAAENTVVEATAFNVQAPADAVRVVKKPVPDPGAGEVLVKMTMRPINPSDVLSLGGVYPGFTRNLPGVPGIDGVGVVAKLGAGVSGLAEGARVTAMGWPAHEGNGSWQEYVVAPAASLVPVPDGIPDDAACQFFVNPVTVVGLLESAAAPAGKYLLVTAAGSTLGRMLLGAAAQRGVKTIGVVRRPEAVEELRAAGATEVLCSASDNLVERVMAITGGEGAWAAIDCIGGEISNDCGNAVREGGVVYVYGAMGGLTAQASVPALIFRGVSYTGFWLKPWLEGLPGPDKVKAVVDEVWEGMRKGYMRPFNGKQFGLSDVKAAIAEAVREARAGKVLLTT